VSAFFSWFEYLTANFTPYALNLSIEYRKVNQRKRVKKVMGWIFFATLALVFCANPAYASMGQMEQPKSDFILFTHLALEDSALGPFLIVLKTSDSQPDVSFFKDGLFAFSVDRSFFDHATEYLQKRKNTGTLRASSKSDTNGFGNFEIRWDFGSGSGSLRTGLNDSIATFEDLGRLSASSNNRSLSEFIGVEIAKLKQATKQ
jgi:hypothetical protein